MKLRNCKVEYHSFTEAKLSTLSALVRNGIYGNADTFLSPPVTAEAFDESRAAFTTTGANYKLYGRTQKTAFIKARNNLTGQLDQTAAYVNHISEGNASTIALSGFTPSKERYERVDSLNDILEFTVKVTNVPGQVSVVISTITNKGAINYNCICSEGAPLSDISLINGQFVMGADNPRIRYDCNKSRRKVFPNLTRGVQYYFYVFASNSAGVSPLSYSQNIWVC